MPKKINVKGAIISNDEKWIYDWFEMENTAPNDITNELPMDNSPVEVIINSPGGYVDAGSEIYTTLKDYAGEVTVKIVGMAASAASVVAMAGDKTLISPTAQMMIHNVSGGVRGDHNTLRHEADVLENFNTSIANAYVLKSGKSHEELLNLMNNETYFTAQQALENGLVDEIMFQNEGTKFVASVQNGALPQNVVDKIRSFKDKLNTIQPTNEPIATPSASTVEEKVEQAKLAAIEEEKQKLLLEIELV